MARYGIFAVSAIMAIGLAFLLPLAVVYYMAHGLNVFAGVLVILISVIAGAAVGVVGMALHFARPFADNVQVEETEETLRVLRASHQALLEEMDDTIVILREIRDDLKGAGGGTR